ISTGQIMLGLFNRGNTPLGVHFDNLKIWDISAIREQPTPLTLIYENRVPWSENNHTYEVVRVRNGITWEAANQDAQARGGHLVTITSKAENDFVFLIASTLENRDGYWLGGYQLPGSSEPDGGWIWVTGEPLGFTYWDSGEPNNSGDENYLEFHFENSPMWNDVNADNYFANGYIIEYE
ncbi:MAG: hypothetical protein MUO77_16765, partial [Anaerolineales bacterium]|nr:hypothetical protein [Anaerolineales bacterium]